MAINSSSEKPVLSVSELNQYARGVLEMHVGQICVTGEISNFSRPASGHWYFTLKDSQAQIRCAMFRNKNQYIRCMMENGKQVIITGSVSIYEGRGEYQLIADYIEESGTGALQRQFELLKNKLGAEGLFDSKHKQPLPAHPEHIAVVTSATGAAIHDILSVLKERFPLLRITLIPCSVQGKNAAPEIVAAIALAERWNSENSDTIDALIVGRGGGSLEDLWAFNEESVARAIYDCKIPVISAVGHEVDTTIADYVADIRAPTPSAAAEMISPDQYALNQQLDFLEQHLTHKMQRILAQRHKELALLKQGLRHPGERLTHLQVQFRQLENRLIHAQSQQQQLRSHNLQMAMERFRQIRPDTLIENEKKHLAELRQKLHKTMQERVELLKNSLSQQTQLLDTVSPLATLQRGYAIITDEKRVIIRAARQASIGDTLTARLAEGELLCEVKKIT